MFEKTDIEETLVNNLDFNNNEIPLNQNINNSDNNDETQDNYEPPRTNEFVTQKRKGKLKDPKRVERGKALAKLMSERRASGKIKKRRTKSYRAGVIFPVPAIVNKLKKTFPGKVKETAGVYLAAVLEYLCAEILELAGNCALELKKVRITPRHILLATKNDDELDRLLNHVILAAGGVFPHIHKDLLVLKKDLLKTLGGNKVLVPSTENFVSTVEAVQDQQEQTIEGEQPDEGEQQPDIGEKQGESEQTTVPLDETEREQDTENQISEKENKSPPKSGVSASKGTPSPSKLGRQQRQPSRSNSRHSERPSKRDGSESDGEGSPRKRGKPQKENDETDEETETEEEEDEYEDEDEDNEEQLSVDSKARMILKKTNEIKKSIDIIHELEKEIMSSPAFKSLHAKKTEEIDDVSEYEESFHKQSSTSRGRKSSYHRKMSPRSLSKLRSEVAKRTPRDEFGRFTSESESDDDEWTPDEERSPSPRKSKSDRYGRARKSDKRRHYSPRSLSRLRSELAKATPRDNMGRFLSEDESEEYDILHRIRSRSPHRRSSRDYSDTYGRSRKSDKRRHYSPRSLSRLRSELAKARPRDERGRFLSEDESEEYYRSHRKKSRSPQRKSSIDYSDGRSRKSGKRRHYSPRSLSRLRSELAKARPRDRLGRFTSEERTPRKKNKTRQTEEEPSTPKSRKAKPKKSEIESEDEEKRSKKTVKQKRSDEGVEEKTKPKAAATKKRLESHPREEQTEEKRTPRKQGRPPKKVAQSKSSKQSPKSKAKPKSEELSADQTPRKRGRPKKVATVEKSSKKEPTEKKTTKTSEKKQSKQADPEPEVLKDEEVDQEEFESPKRRESIKLNLTENLYAVSAQEVVYLIENSDNTEVAVELEEGEEKKNQSFFDDYHKKKLSNDQATYERRPLVDATNKIKD